MGLSTLFFAAKTFTSKSTSAQSALFKYITLSITACATLAYLVMALGRSDIVSGQPELTPRAFLWVRYADWAITTPLIIVDLALLVGVPYADIFFLIIADLLMIASGFAGATSMGHNAVWPLFCFSMLAFVPILYALTITFPKFAKAKSAATGALYQKLGGVTLLMWIG